MYKRYDPKRRCLVFFSERASETYWDSLWASLPSAAEYSVMEDAIQISEWFAKAISANGKVLEAGCGNGGVALAMHRRGLNVVGIDSAKATVDQLQDSGFPFNIRLGDVRALEFSDEQFDGYYSGGVIEHFWDGYDVVLSEAFRVLKPGGIAIFSVPHMNLVRSLKAKLRCYEYCSYNLREPANYYQFALNVQHVRTDLRNSGFLVRSVRAKAGLKGLSEEFAWVNKVLGGSNSGLAKRLIAAIGRLGTPIWGHSAYIIAIKNKSV